MNLNKKRKIIKKRNIEVMTLVDMDNTLCGNCTECHCCKNNTAVDILSIEVDVIRPLITNAHRARAKASKNQKVLTGVYDCPFLEDGRCSIYEHRPIGCASYIVVRADTDDGCKYTKDSVYYFDRIALFKKMGIKHFPKEEADSESDFKDILDLF